MFKQRCEVVARARLGKAGLAEVELPDVDGFPGLVVFDDDNGEPEPLRLIQRAEHLGPRQRDVVGSLHPPLHLDEVQVAAIRDNNSKLRELEKRKETVLKSIEEQGKLTDKLKRIFTLSKRIARLWVPKEV